MEVCKRDLHIPRCLDGRWVALSAHSFASDHAAAWNGGHGRNSGRTPARQKSGIFAAGVWRRLTKSDFCGDHTLLELKPCSNGSTG